jgi:hypothetical protein
MVFLRIVLVELLLPEPLLKNNARLITGIN